MNTGPVIPYGSGTIHSEGGGPAGGGNTPVTGEGGLVDQTEEVTSARQVVEVLRPSDIEKQRKITERINTIPDPADRIILINAFNNFGLRPEEIDEYIHRNIDEEGSNALRLAVGASFNNTLTTLEKMEQEIKQGQDPFTSPQYIRLQIAGNTQEDPTSVVYIPVENSFALDGMSKALRANLWMLNTIGKGPGESNLDYRRVYEGIPINPELVSIMDQHAFDIEMFRGDLSGMFTVTSVSEDGTLAKGGPQENVAIADEQQGIDYNQPFDWEISNAETVPTDSLNDVLGFHIRAIGSREGNALLMVKDKPDLVNAIERIKGYLKYARSVSGNDIQFLPGGILCIPRLENELHRFRRIYDLGKEVTYTSSLGEEISQMRIPGEGNIPITEFYGYENFSTEGKSLKESVAEGVIGLPFTMDYEVTNALAEAYGPGAVISELVNFVARPNMPIDPVLKLINTSDDIKREDLPKLLRSIGDYNILSSDLNRVAEMIITLRDRMNTQN